MHNEPVETETIGDLEIKIYTDEDAQGPDEMDGDEIFLVHYHRDFEVTRDKVVSKDAIRALYTSEESEELNEVKKLYHLFPVAAYIHSGVYLSLGSGGFACDSGGWDTSHVGAVLVSKKEWPSKKEAEQRAKGVIETWNQYLSGDIYGYVIERDGDHVDSCWGFYGMKDCQEEARQAAEYEIKHEKEEKQKISRINAL